MSGTDLPVCTVYCQPESKRIGTRRPPLSAGDPVASLPCWLCPPNRIDSKEPVALLVVGPLTAWEQRMSQAGQVYAAMACLVHHECVIALDRAEMRTVVADLAKDRADVTLRGGLPTWTGGGLAEPDPTMPLVIASLSVQMATVHPDGGSEL